jgi:hypothetical protein
MRKASVTVRPCRMGGSCRSGSAALGWRFQAAPSVVVIEERGGQNSESRRPGYANTTPLANAIADETLKRSSAGD